VNLMKRGVTSKVFVTNQTDNLVIINNSFLNWDECVLLDGDDCLCFNFLFAENSG